MEKQQQQKPQPTVILPVALMRMVCLLNVPCSFPHRHSGGAVVHHGSEDLLLPCSVGVGKWSGLPNWKRRICVPSTQTSGRSLKSIKEMKCLSCSLTVTLVFPRMLLQEIIKKILLYPVFPMLPVSPSAPSTYTHSRPFQFWNCSN